MVRPSGRVIAVSDILRMEVRSRVQWYAGYIRRTDPYIITIEDTALTTGGYYVRRELPYMFDNDSRNPWYLEIQLGKMNLMDASGMPLFRQREIKQSAMWVREKFDFVNYGNGGERRFQWWLDYRFPDSSNDVHALVTARTAAITRLVKNGDIVEATHRLQNLTRELALYRLGAAIPRE